MARMRHLPILLALFVAALAVSHSSAAPKSPVPKFITLDMPNAKGGTQPHRINDNGQVIGFYDIQGRDGKGFLLARGKYTTLHLPSIVGGSLYVIATNKVGQIAGSYIDPNNHKHGYLITHGRYTAIEYPDAVSTEIWDLNNKGQVLGSYNDGVQQHIFFYKQGIFTRVPFPEANGTVTNVFGMNDKGQIVGHLDKNNYPHSFVLDHGICTLIDYPKSNGTMPFGINNKGQVVGVIYPLHETGKGFLWDHGKFTEIDFPNATHTTAFGINDNGQIVGFYWDSQDHEHGFLRNP